MIIISGKHGEGSGLITNLAVESLINENPRAVILLLDERSEFAPLKNKLNGIKINIGIGYKAISEQLEDAKRLYIIHSNIPFECCLLEIKEAEKMLFGTGNWVFVIYKTTDIKRALLIKREFEKLI